MFSQFCHQKQISQNRENLPQTKQKQQKSTIFAENWHYFVTYLLHLWRSTSEQALWKGPLKRGLPCQNRPLQAPTSAVQYLCQSVVAGIFYSPNFVRQVVWQSSKFGDRSETKRYQNLQIL
jgi:hypothetical protein